MRSQAPIRRRGRERGDTAYVVLLAIVLVVGMFVLSTVTASTTAMTTETARVYQERAHWNAYSGAIEAEADAQSEVPPALERLLGELQASEQVDWSDPVLAGLAFPKLSYRYDFSGRAGYTSDDRAEVT